MTLPCKVLDCHNSCDTGHIPGVLCLPAAEHRQEDQQQPRRNIIIHLLSITITEKVQYLICPKNSNQFIQTSAL